MIILLRIRETSLVCVSMFLEVWVCYSKLCSELRVVELVVLVFSNEFSLFIVNDNLCRTNKLHSIIMFK